MRIIAGEKRGLLLLSPQDESVRPTHDRVREAVFGALQFYLQGKVFIDLFSGSGAVGIEALSRGAAFAHFSDNSAGSLKITCDNIRRAGFESRSCIHKNGFICTLNELEPSSADIVYIDPPYASGYYVQAVQMLVERKILRDGAYVILESDCEMPDYPGLVTGKRKKYGKAYVGFYRYEK